MRTLFHNARLVLPDSLIEQGWLLIEGARILALGEGAASLHAAEWVIDAQQALLMPGLIDLHCDAIEKVVEPGPHVFFDINFALQQVDWRLAGSGITTEFHVVSLDDGEFSVRSDRFVYDPYAGLQVETELLIRHKLHVRLELSSEKGLSDDRQRGDIPFSPHQFCHQEMIVHESEHQCRADQLLWRRLR